jgi:hypothetical protein
MTYTVGQPLTWYWRAIGSGVLASPPPSHPDRHVMLSRFMTSWSLPLSPSPSTHDRPQPAREHNCEPGRVEEQQPNREKPPPGALRGQDAATRARHHSHLKAAMLVTGYCLIHYLLSPSLRVTLAGGETRVSAVLEVVPSCNSNTNDCSSSAGLNR